MGSKWSNARMYLAATVAAILIVFAVDIVTPAGLAVEILYAPILLYAAWYLRPRQIAILFIFCVLLTAIGVGLEFPALTTKSFRLRACNSIAAMAVTAALTWLALQRRQYATLLKTSYDTLRINDQRMRDSETLYRSLVENVPQSVFRKNAEGIFTFANSQFCRMLDKPVDQVLGTTDFDHCLPKLAEKYRADDLQVMSTGQILEVVEDIQMPTGEIRQLQTVKTPLIDHDGQMTGIQGIFWDITEKQRVQEAIRRSEQEFRELAENIPDVVARFDREFRHIYVNPAVERVTGQRVEDFLGKTHNDLNAAPEHLDLWQGAIRSVFETHQETAIKFAYESPTGLWHFESRLVPELSASGSVESVLAICRDVTNQVRIQQQEQEHVVALAHATRLSTIGGLVSEISHEINQPLHVIANFAQAGIHVLEKDSTEQSPQLFNWFKQISEQSKRAAAIIRRVGKFGSKADSRACIDINELVRDSLLLFNFDLRVHHVQMDCKLAAVPPLIFADAIQIQQVLINLLRNALEALSENEKSNRHVRIQTEKAQGQVLLSVQDNGCGLPAGTAEQLFKPFFTTKSEGMGLGLSVCQSIVQSYQGRLWAEPNQHRGATFYVALPIHKETVQETNGQV